ncbi:MAG: hypothetical protein JO058_03980 [Alphaproteobacteria bacterium]|nr:hypothetical protein [Alphaproteobacteria bacterium]
MSLADVLTLLFADFLLSIPATGRELLSLVSIWLHQTGDLIAGAIIGIVTAVGVAIWIENLRRPRLRLTIEPPLDQQYSPGHPASSARCVRVLLHNRELSWLTRWMVREAALQCHATVRFRRLDGRNVFDSVMEGRWSGSPEPLPSKIVDQKGVLVGSLLDYGLFSRASRIDVYPGDIESLDIATRFDNEPQCYGWNNEAYFSSPPWRNPRRRIEPGRYFVDVTVRSSGQTCTDQFLLINEGQRSDFRLEYPPRRGKRAGHSQQRW